jgi:hypothetical protein
MAREPIIQHERFASELRPPAKRRLIQTFDVQNGARGNLRIGIDDKGQLYVMPDTKTFPYLYREAMEIYWDENEKHLFAPSPLRAQKQHLSGGFKKFLLPQKSKRAGCASLQKQSGIMFR